MKLSRLAVLIPCKSLDELSLQRSAQEAEEFLSCVCALWHPLLLHTAQEILQFLPADEPPADPAEYLIACPGISEPLVPADWFQQAEQCQAVIVRRPASLQQAVDACLSAIEAPPVESIDQDLVWDFLALGFCHFMVEMLTRQLRYMSNLDEVSLRASALRAAAAAVEGNADSVRDNLQSAFDRLRDSREYYYPVEAHLIDLTLVAPTTLGEPLRQQLAGRWPCNYLVEGRTLQQMAVSDPQAIAALREAVEKGVATIVGGELEESPLPLLPPEAIRAGLLRGVRVYEQLLGVRPEVYARRRFGLTPVLPQILQLTGFNGAVHSTLDDGRFPTGNQSRIQWEGLDGTVIESLARVPVDITSADAFLRLPERLGSFMDVDYAAPVVLAHWPGQFSPWYELLRRTSKYTTVTGAFTTIAEYFQRTSYSGQRNRYTADQYRSPYLVQAVASGQRDPLSRWVRYYTRRAQLEAAASLRLLALACGAPTPTGDAQPSGAAHQQEELSAAVDQLLLAPSDKDDALDARVTAAVAESMSALAEALGRPDGPQVQGRLLLNPWSFTRRLVVELPRFASPPEVAGVVRAAGRQQTGAAAVVDVPAMGFAWIAPGPEQPPAAETKSRGWLFRRTASVVQEPPMVEEDTLRNEFFQVRMDRQTGGIRAIVAYNTRGPRLAQQLAMRLPGGDESDPADDSHYSQMVCEELTIRSTGPIVAEAFSRGRLLDRKGRRLAGFEQVVRVCRGSRVVELDIALEIDHPPGENPWRSYYAARFAWNDETANLYRSVNMVAVPTDVDRLEAPHFIEIRSGKGRTTLLAGGLPFHRRLGLRKIDTLLVVRGETARRFRLGIGIDLRHPMHEAIALLSPRCELEDVPPPPAQCGWLFHLDVGNVVATSWEPLFEASRLDGFRVRLLETEGKRARLGLRAVRPLRCAQRLLPGETPPVELTVEGDRLEVEIGPYAWVAVEARFQ